MAESIRLFRGAFGHVSILHVAGDLVTHAHAEAHIIVWLGGAAGEMTIGRETHPPRPGPCRGRQCLRTAQSLPDPGRGLRPLPRLLSRSGLAARAAMACLRPARCSPGRPSGSSPGSTRRR